MLEKENTARRFALVKFEELIQNPFKTSQRLFERLELAPTELPRLRLKSKRVLSESGDHQTRFGEEGKKYWFAPNEIGQVLDAEIDRVQADGLDARSRKEFEEQASDVMELLGYAE